MAVERVGRAYVIRAKDKPTKRAEYWAGLVTSEKYKLWEAAQKEALAQMKIDQLDYQSQMQIYKAQLDDLQNYRKTLASEVDSLSQGLLKGTPKTTTRTTSGTRREGGRSSNSRKSEFNKQLEKVRDVSGDIAKAQGEIALYSDSTIDTTAYQNQVDTNADFLLSMFTNVEQSDLTEYQKENIKNNIRKNAATYGLQNVQNVVGAPLAEEDIVKLKTQEDTTIEPTGGAGYVPYSTTSRTTTGGGLSAEERQKMLDRIAQLQTEIASTQASEQELVRPELDRTGLLERTRGVYREDLGQKPVLPRLSELDFLGLTDQERESISPPSSSPVTLPSLPSLLSEKESVLSEDFNTIREPIEPVETAGIPEKEEDELDQFFQTPAQKPIEPIRPEIAYKREVITGSYDENLVKSKDDLVDRLYKPHKNQTPQERAELLQNAWQEITLAYDNREQRKKAHMQLLAIDRKYNEDQKPK
jgi:hypothetical protein